MNAITAIKNDITMQPGINVDMITNFVEFIDRSEKTTRTYLTNLKQFIAWMSSNGIEKPSRQDIISYRQWLSAEHTAISYDPETGYTVRKDRNGNAVRVCCKPTTVKGYLQSVKEFFAWTAANNLYPNIAVNVHPPKITDSHKKDSFTASEVLAIENSIAAHAAQKTAAASAAVKDKTGKQQRSTEQGKRLYAMYLLAVNAGLRTIEISRANVRDIETKAGQSYLYIWGKGHSAPDQKKPIAPEVKAAIDDYMSSRTDSPNSNSPLFVSTGNRSHGKRIAATTISTMLKGAMIEAGFNSERLTAHSLRHSAAQNVMQLTGNNIYQTQQYLRHSSPKTTEIYLENDSTEQDAIIAKRLYNHFHGKDENTVHSIIDGIAVLDPKQLDQLGAFLAALMIPKRAKNTF